jgi:hypothetical protein
MKMANIVRSAILIAALLMSSVLSLPNITVVPLPNTCASYPGYDNTTDQAGPWIPIAESPGNTVDGFKFEPIFLTPSGDLKWGFVSSPCPRYLCTGSHLFSNSHIS